MAWKSTNRSGVSLSKSILEMKFMKRTKEKVEKQAFNQEGEEFFGQQNLAKTIGTYGTVTSFVLCEDLIEGRLSFGGENPELERLIELENLAKQAKNEPAYRQDPADVSDVEMAGRWRSTTKINISNMENSKKHPRNDRDHSTEPSMKKPKYIRRKDD